MMKKKRTTMTNTFSQSTTDRIKQLFKRNTPIVNKSEMFISYKSNPNDMGVYLPLLTPAVDQTTLKIPFTKIITIPFELIVSIYNMDFTTNEREALNEILQDNFLQHPELQQDVFVKSGTYSDKFNFANPLITNQQFANHMIEVFYGSTLGAGMVNHAIFREYIKPHASTPTIYNGMPLRQEIRFFVDFDTKTVLGYADYWHPKYMVSLVSKNTITPEQAKTIAQSELQDPSTKTYLINSYIDYLTWYEWYSQPHYQDTWSHILTKALPEIEKVVATNQIMTGQWSMDIMSQSDDLYFIDAALMKQSALVDCMIPL